jgi:hypothetical protein
MGQFGVDDLSAHADAIKQLSRAQARSYSP